MSTMEAAEPAPLPGVPTWDESKKFRATRIWLRILIILVVILWVALIVWVFFYATITDAPASQLPVGANIAIVLAPVLASAAAVERTLETTFNTMERSWRTMVAYLGRGLRWLKNTETEVKQARQFLADISEKYNAEMQNIQLDHLSASALTQEIQNRLDAANGIMALAQARLEAAENNLADVTESDAYVTAKTAASIIVGLMLGVVIATIGQLQMFAMLGIGLVPPKIDVLITGLIIGSGAYPVHSLVGILQQGKDTLDSVKGYFNRAAPVAQAVKQRITTMQSSPNEGEAPQVQQSVIETTTAKSTEEKQNK